MITQLSRFAAPSAAALFLLAALVPGAALAQSNGSRTTGPTLSSDKPVQIESDKLEVHQNDSTATFSGNVSVIQGDTLLKAGTLTVHYTKQDDKGSAGKEDSAAAASLTGADTSRIESIEADGKVYVKSKDQVATGDHGKFDMKTQVLVMTGDEVVLTQGDNVIVGCKLTVQMKSGEAQLDSCKGGKSPTRVRMLLKPNEKQTSQQASQ